VTNRLALQKWLNEQQSYQPEKLTQLIAKCHNVDFLKFNDIIGLPRKNGVEMPIFDYEQLIEKLLLHDNVKYLMIKKSVGLGITECILRIILFCCLKNEAWQDRQVVILVGPSVSLAVKLVKRLKAMLEPHGIFFETKETFLELNKVQIECFPSHHLDSFRSLTSPAMVYISEADFFPAGQQDDVRLISERYIAKSDPMIVMESTPNAPGGLFDRIEREANSVYYKLKLDCYSGLGRIYTQAEIDAAKRSASFAREMSPLLYLGGSGNVFSDYVVSENTNGEYSLNPSDYQYCLKAAGCDWGSGSSKTALVILAYVPEVQKIRVIYSKQWERPDYSLLFPEIWNLLLAFQVKHLYVDGSSPSNVQFFMSKYGDDCHPSYHDRIEFYKKQYRKLNNEKYWEKFYHVIPLNWSTEGRKLLSSFKLLMDNNLFESHKTMLDLSASFRSATMADKFDLQKSNTINSDLFDATIAAAREFNFKGNTHVY
jgi:hypothetical protein